MSIPARERKRQVVLRYLAATDFEDGRDYPEREVDSASRCATRTSRRCAATSWRAATWSGSRGIYRRRPVTGWPVDPDDAASTQPRDEASPEE